VKRGDLVFFQGRTWLVQMYDPRRLRVAQLLAADGAALEVACDLDKTDPTFLVLSNPSADWPFVTVPEKPRWGRVREVSRILNRQLLPLTPIADWVLAEPMRCGGALFLNPALSLKPGDILQVGYEKSESRSNVGISPTFGTVTHRKAVAAAAPKVKKGPASSYDRLLSDDEGFDT